MLIASIFNVIAEMKTNDKYSEGYPIYTDEVMAYEGDERREAAVQGDYDFDGVSDQQDYDTCYALFRNRQFEGHPLQDAFKAGSTSAKIYVGRRVNFDDK